MDEWPIMRWGPARGSRSLLERYFILFLASKQTFCYDALPYHSKKQENQTICNTDGNLYNHEAEETDSFKLIFLGILPEWEKPTQELTLWISQWMKLDCYPESPKHGWWCIYFKIFEKKISKTIQYCLSKSLKKKSDRYSRKSLEKIFHKNCICFTNVFHKLYFTHFIDIFITYME